MTDTIFNLTDDELLLARKKIGDKNKLLFSVLLKYCQLEGHYPKHIKYVDPLMVQCVANQLYLSPSLLNDVDLEGRSSDRFRQEIRDLLGLRRAKLKDIDDLNYG